MQPEYPSHDYSIDYLNQIAAKPPQRGLSPRVRTLLIGLGVALVVVLGLSAFLNRGEGTTDQAIRLAVRISHDQTLARDAQNRLTSGALRGLNSSLSLTLADLGRDLNPIAEQHKIDLDKPREPFGSQESVANLMAELEEAQLNVKFDSVYAKSMALRLQQNIYLAQTILAKSRTDSLRTLAQKAVDNLTQLQERFAKFQASV